MQAPLAAIGFLLAVGEWLLAGDWRWLLGACVLVANWPYTLLVIMPTNRTLMAAADGTADASVRGLIQRWGHLHAVRTALGTAATVIFLWAAL
jgi:hypothetical protein